MVETPFFTFLGKAMLSYVKNLLQEWVKDNELRRRISNLLIDARENVLHTVGHLLVQWHLFFSSKTHFSHKNTVQKKAKFETAILFLDTKCNTIVVKSRVPCPVSRDWVRTLETKLRMRSDVPCNYLCKTIINRKIGAGNYC